MATWKNLDTLASYSKLNSLKDHVNIAEAMSGEQGAERVKKYSVPMAAGLAYNYAAGSGTVFPSFPSQTAGTYGGASWDRK